MRLSIRQLLAGRSNCVRISPVVCVAVLNLLAPQSGSGQTIQPVGVWQFTPGTVNGSNVPTTLLDGEPAYFQITGDPNVPSSWQITGTLNGPYSADTSSYAIGFSNFGEAASTGGYMPAGIQVTLNNSLTLTNAFADVPVFVYPLDRMLGGALVAGSFGGNGNPNPPKNGYEVVDAGGGGTVNITHNGSISISSTLNDPGQSGFIGINGILAVSLGGTGVAVQAHDTPFAGNGGNGNTVTLTTATGSSITATNTGTALTIGLQGLSEGGLPAVNSGAGNAYGASGTGGQVTVTHGGQIEVNASSGIGILATSIGGAGGTLEYNSDPNDIYYAESAPGGTVGVTLLTGSSVKLNGGGIGVVAASTAGDANESAYSEYNAAGEDATVTIESGAKVDVLGGDNFALGVVAISSGTATVLNPFASGTIATGGNGQAGDATINNYGTIRTKGDMAIGMVGLSVGGAGIVATAGGGDESYLGNYGDVNSPQGAGVTLNNYGTVTTLGATAHGMVAVSTAGGGILNNRASGHVIIGGATTPEGSLGYNGGSVTINSSGSITTGDGIGGGLASIGIVAQSIGGGGGTAGSSTPAFLVGDSGGNGGDGGTVDVNLSSLTLLTRDKGSPGILAQSIGGGGGNGANAAGIFVATGGAGGSGGDGGSVTLDLSSGKITTLSHFSPGMITHSIGGGGGHGGYADSIGLFIDVATGGSGGSGGNGGTVETTNSGATISTSGNQSPGMVIHSIGGGGGTGGAANAFSAGAVLDISIAMGGSGGGGGEAGFAIGTNNGTIQTGVGVDAKKGPNINGADSIGMIVQSIGGGGGSGGAATAKALSMPAADIPVSASFSVSLGGSGGSGGNGGNVVAVNSDSSKAVISTIGDGSHGILAQSIGGGGGNGGDSTATSAVLATDAVGINVSVALGGTGGDGGSAGSVTVINGSGSYQDVNNNTVNITGNGSITTKGQYSAGIVAQAIGGGGGNGGAGNASQGSLDQIDLFGGDEDEDDDDKDDDDDEVSFTLTTTISLGGAAGTAGNGGTVDVTNSAGSTIQTSGSASPGILAQSIGGGGGNGGGGGGNSSASGNDFDISVTVGGKGGSGVDGGSVTVTNDGTITTKGGDAFGILAQSIGGGGGNGGTSDASGSTNAVGQIEDYISPPNDSYDAQVAVGGSGGGGGDGGSVTVTNSAGTINSDGTYVAGISTKGVRAHGILAQSIGNGGGNGGTATSSSNSVIGGPGTDDKGESNRGVYSANVSVGGGGGASGTGGEVSVTNTGVITTAGYSAHGVLAQSVGGGGGTGGDGSVDSTATIGLGAAVSGTNSNGGAGGTVSVAHSGAIVTTGADASGIIAQSIGGGGGLASTGMGSLNTSKTPFLTPASDLTVGIGRAAGAAGQGQTVTVTVDNGILQTAGDWSHGIFAHSIGGGGGKASSIFSTASTALLSFQVGNNIGNGNAKGGSVSIEFEGTNSITTKGYSAFGVLAQSIGGGGGMASDGSANVGNGTSSTLAFPGIQVGFDGVGNGDDVSLSGNASITTSGDAAHAILLQSIGGSGGIGAQGSSDGVEPENLLRVSAGGLQNAEGDGGQIQLPGSELIISTKGNNAFGLLAQSIGGGGGLASAQFGSGGSTYAGGQNSSVSNDGGEIDIALTSGSSIETAGDGAHGIVAQSIGGGGGIANYPTGTPTYSTFPSRLSDASSGNGGTVNLVIDATISTTGDGAFGIFAQSVGGGGGWSANGSGVSLGSTTAASSTGSGGSVVVNQSGSISVSGENSVGIFAQSVDTQSGGTVQVTVNGSVTGGSGDGGAGVWIANGNDSNTLTIADNASVSAASGVAINYTGPFGIDVTNSGVVTGSMNIGNGTFSNDGTLVVSNDATTSKIQKSNRTAAAKKGASFDQATINGNFEQTPNGAIVVRADFSRGKADFLQINGDAKFDGKLLTNVTSVLPLVEIPVLKVTGKVSGDISADLVGAGSTLFQFGVELAGKKLMLSATGANFDPDGIHLSENQKRMADHLESIWYAGGTPEFGELFSTLDNLATNQSGEYVAALQQLGPGASFGFAARRVADMRAFSESVLSYPRFTGDGTTLVEGEYTWGRMDGHTARQNGSDGFRINTLLWQVGGQAEISPGWFVGGAAAFETSWLEANDGFSSGSGQGGLGAVTLKYQTEPWLFEGAVFGSFGFYDTHRSIRIPGFAATAEGSPDVQSAGFTLRAAHTCGTDRFYFRPSLALSTIYVHAGGYDEVNAGALALQVQESDQTAFIATPALEIGARIDLANSMVLRTFVNAGVDLSTANDWSQSVRLTGSPAGTGFTSTTIPMDDVVGRVSAGVQLKASERVDFFLQYDGEFSENVSGHGGAFGATWWF